MTLPAPKNAARTKAARQQRRVSAARGTPLNTVPPSLSCSMRRATSRRVLSASGTVKMDSRLPPSRLWRLNSSRGVISMRRLSSRKMRLARAGFSVS